MARQRRSLPGCCPVASQTSLAARRGRRARLIRRIDPGWRSRLHSYRLVSHGLRGVSSTLGYYS